MHPPPTHDNNVKTRIAPPSGLGNKGFCRPPQARRLMCRYGIKPTCDCGARLYLDKNQQITFSRNYINFGPMRIAPCDISRPNNAIPMHAQIHSRPKFCKNPLGIGAFKTHMALPENSRALAGCSWRGRWRCAHCRPNPTRHSTQLTLGHMNSYWKSICLFPNLANRIYPKHSARMPRFYFHAVW